MSKDPAFLFYPGDWLGGTMGMTFEEKGAYLELLVMQWNCQRITKDDAIRIVGDKLWTRLKKKFSCDSDGLFFNQRLELEKQRRNAFSEKQKSNAAKRWHKPGIATAMPLENVNRDEDSIENKLKGAFDEIYLDQEKMKWLHIDFNFEFEAFKNKVRGSEDHYRNHDVAGIRLAFQSQLRYAKQKNKNGTGLDKVRSIAAERQALIDAKYGPDKSGS